MKLSRYDSLASIYVEHWLARLDYHLWLSAACARHTGKRWPRATRLTP